MSILSVSNGITGRVDITVLYNWSSWHYTVLYTRLNLFLCCLPAPCLVVARDPPPLQGHAHRPRGHQGGRAWHVDEPGRCRHATPGPAAPETDRRVPLPRVLLAHTGRTYECVRTSGQGGRGPAWETTKTSRVFYTLAYLVVNVYLHDIMCVCCFIDVYNHTHAVW